MTEREMRQLGRTDLLQMLLEQGKENEQLKERIKELETQLNDRTLRFSKVGSIAEAALAVNGVFEAAEASCLQYIENIRRLNAEQDALSAERNAQSKAEAENILREAREKCSAMEQETRKKCEEQLRDTEKTVEEKWAQISQRLTALYQSHQGLMELVSQGMSLVPERGGSVAKEAASKTEP